MRKALAGLSLSTAALFMVAAPASAHGDSGNACVASDGVHGATRGRYGAGTPWLATGDPVPLSHDGAALTGVGGDGWDRPLGQLPDCPVSTTTTRPATTTSTTTRPTSGSTSTTSASSTSTTGVTPTTCAYNGQPIECYGSTTTNLNVGTPETAQPHGTTGSELPRTGDDGGVLALTGAVLALAGVGLIRVCQKNQEDVS